MTELFHLFLNNLLPVFLIAGAGALLASITSIDTRSLSQLILYLFSPCLIFSLLIQSEVSNDQFIRIGLFSIALVIIIGGITWLIGKLLRIERPTLSSMMLAGPRLTFALAEQKLLPGWFMTIHERYSSPANSVMFLGGMSLVIAMSGTFVQLAIATSLARLLAFVVCIAALPVIRRRASKEQLAHAYRLSGGYTIPALAFVLCLWLVAQSALDSWLIVGGLLVLGLIPYFLTQRHNRTQDAV